MNEKDNYIEINISVNTNERMIYLSQENSSGCKYHYNNKKELNEIFGNYIEDILYERNKNRELGSNKKQFTNKEEDEEEI